MATIGDTEPDARGQQDGLDVVLRRVLSKVDALSVAASDERERNDDARSAFIDAMMDRVPGQYRTASLSDFDNLRTFGLSDALEGAHVLVVGPTGIGKTHAAAALCRAFAERWRKIAWIRAHDAVFGLAYDFAAMRQRLASQIARADLIVVDDISIEGATEHVKAAMNVFVSMVYDSGKQRFVTSNLTGKDLAEVYGPRVVGRLIEDGVVVHVSSDTDIRARRATVRKEVT